MFLAICLGEFVKTGNYENGLFWLILFIVLIPISWGIIKFSEKKIEILPIKVKSVAPADREVAAFLIAYILPMLNIVNLNIWTIIFIVGLLYIAILTTSNYHFNPILSLFFGYHYYEVEIEENNGEKTTYILMTKKTIRSSRDVKKVVQVSDYMLMEVNI